MFSQIKLYLGIAVFAAFAFLYFLYNSAVAERELLEVQYNEVVARTERDKAKINELSNVMDNNSALYVELANDHAINQNEITSLNKTISHQRQENDKLAKMLAKHDLKALINKNQSRMELRMRNATDRLFDKFEAATRRNKDSL